MKLLVLFTSTLAIYGPGIGPAAAVNAAPVNGFYPSTLSGVQVTVNGTNMPLLYVSASQISAVVPMETRLARARRSASSTDRPSFRRFQCGSTPPVRKRFPPF
jgi:uncharacterized protein (TIGR03437 family)